MNRKECGVGSSNMYIDTYKIASSTSNVLNIFYTQFYIILYTSEVKDKFIHTCIQMYTGSRVLHTSALAHSDAHCSNSKFY